VLRWALKEGLPSPLFAPAMALGQDSVRACCRPALQAKVPPRQDAGTWPTRTHARKVLLLAGCVQPAMAQHQQRHSPRAGRGGIQTVVDPNAGCCGAVKFHLNDQDGGMEQMRANIDAWWPYVPRRQRHGQRRRSHRHERVGLRRHRQGIRPHPA
jgi:glycolate oxidase iron-sulfur subunit